MFRRAFFDLIIDEYQHMHFFTFNTVLVSYWSTFKYFYCILTFKINILDSVECEKVHVLVFINYSLCVLHNRHYVITLIRIPHSVVVSIIQVNKSRRMR